MSNYSDDPLVEAILKSNPLGIKVLKDFQQINCCRFNSEAYPNIEKLMHANDVLALQAIPSNLDTVKDLLTIVKITDQDGREYFVTEYNPVDLWLEAEIIGYYPIEPASV